MSEGGRRQPGPLYHALNAPRTLQPEEFWEYAQKRRTYLRGVPPFPGRALVKLSNHGPAAAPLSGPNPPGSTGAATSPAT